MGDRLKFERFIWIHSRIKAGRYPNAGDLARRFEISRRTAQRDIEFMRDRLEAPLDYHKRHKGYRYTEGSYELPSLWFTEDNIVALVLAARLAAAIPDYDLKGGLNTAIRKILELYGTRKGLSLEDLSGKISVKNVEYARTDGPLFHTIVDALFNKRGLTIIYYSPHTNKETKRTILPLHLMQYMGSWHVISFCTRQSQLRDFALSRIRDVKVAYIDIDLPAGLPSIKEYTRRHFGIMQGIEAVTVRLRFAPKAASWVQEQIWHPRQRSTYDEDGGLTLEFPVADFREIKRKILSHGSRVKVLAPKTLAEEVREEIKRMAGRYS